MHRDELIRLAREAGAEIDHGHRGDDPPQLKMYERAIERFAALVAADEREKCAKVCDDLPMQQAIDVRDQAAAAIRARKDDEQ